MDTTNSALLNIIQDGFPICPHPYEELGKLIGLAEDEVLKRVNALRDAKIIRRLGANFQSKALGFTSTLCAAKVPEDRLDGFIKAVNAHSEVTHNYLRRHSYNVWFTVIARDRTAVQVVLDDIMAKTGIQVWNLPAKRMYKIKVNFHMGGE